MMGLGRSSIIARVAFSLLILLLPACGFEGADPDDTQSRTASIVNGHATGAYPAVGLLEFVFADKTTICSGTLVAPQWVLTAAHCMLREGNKASYAYFSLGSKPRAAVSEMVPHPSHAADDAPHKMPDGTMVEDVRRVEADIALIRLAKAVTAVRPMPISDAVPEPHTPLTLVGYGITGYGRQDSGIKRVTYSSLAALADNYDDHPSIDGFTLGPVSGNNGTTCMGDSGGPSIANIGFEKVMGVASLMDCAGYGLQTRVDLYANWLKTETHNTVTTENTHPQPPPKETPEPQPNPQPQADTTAPVVRLVSPAPNSQVPSQTRVTASAYDATGVSLVMLKVDGIVKGQLAAAPYGFDVTLSVGVHRLEVTARDAAGNQSSASAAVMVVPASPTTSDPQAGCSVGSEPRGSLGGLWLLLLLLVQRMKRQAESA